jgi:hypothetical protein
MSLTSNCSQARPGNFISARRRSSEGGSTASTRQKSSASPGCSFWMRPASAYANAAEDHVDHGAKSLLVMEINPESRPAFAAGERSR